MPGTPSKRIGPNSRTGAPGPIGAGSHLTDPFRSPLRDRARNSSPTSCAPGSVDGPARIGAVMPAISRARRPLPACTSVAPAIEAVPPSRRSGSKTRKAVSAPAIAGTPRKAASENTSVALERPHRRKAASSTVVFPEPLRPVKIVTGARSSRTRSRTPRNLSISSRFRTRVNREEEPSGFRSLLEGSRTRVTFAAIALTPPASRRSGGRGSGTGPDRAEHRIRAPRSRRWW